MFVLSADRIHQTLQLLQLRTCRCCIHTIFLLVSVFRWRCLATETLCCTWLCHRAVANAHTHTCTHFLIWTSTPPNMLNIDGHWWSQHTRVVSGETEGSSSVFYVWTHPGSCGWTVCSSNTAQTSSDSSNRRAVRLLSAASTHRAAETHLKQLQTQRWSDTDRTTQSGPPPAHPVGLPWQRVTWLPLVTGATGPDASRELKKGGRGGVVKSSRRMLQERKVFLSVVHR